MRLGEVGAASVPKMVLLSRPRHGGLIATRCFIPHRMHETIGVLCAVSVATACLLPDGPAARLSAPPAGRAVDVEIEHPSGTRPLALRRDTEGQVVEAGSIRTARKLFDGLAFA